MAEIVARIFTTIFGSHSMIATLVVSMFPIIELKGAIPLGMSVEFWGENALSERQAFLISLIGSCLVIPIIALVFRPILNYMKNTKAFKRLAEFILNKVKKSSEKVELKTRKQTISPGAKTLLKMIGIFLFVADPFPFTGVWTGTCIGVIIGLKFWQVVIANVLGNIVSATLVTFVCSAFPQFTDIMFYVVIAIVLIGVIYGLVKTLYSNKKQKES